MVEWRYTAEPVPYPQAVAWMEDRVQGIIAGRAAECVWLLEHPPMYTAGSSAKPSDLLDPRFEVHPTRRGGQYTYHGPGQRVVYAMIDLNRRGRDIRAYVERLENWIIAALGTFQVRGQIRDGRVGVWVTRPEKPDSPDGSPAEDKIAAIGVRVRKWVAFHGFSINVDPDLGHYDGIVPCGLSSYGVTSLVDLGLPVTIADIDVALKHEFEHTFAM